jgi:hypothetical protein
VNGKLAAVAQRPEPTEQRITSVLRPAGSSVL